MARLVRREGTAPREMVINGKPVWVCTCGLSNGPLCSGRHKLVAGEEPGKLYLYEPARREVKIIDA